MQALCHMVKKSTRLFAAPKVANVHSSLRILFPLVLPFQLPKSKLNPREFELSQQFMFSRSVKQSVKTASGSGAGVHSVALVANTAFSKTGYHHFRYVKRDDEEESLDSESSYGEDSETDEEI